MRLVGKATEEIRAALESGELKTVVLFGVDPLRDFPDTAAWDRALTAADHVDLPSRPSRPPPPPRPASSSRSRPTPRKTAPSRHPDGRLQRVRPSASRPGDIRPNWGVLAELSLALGHDTNITLPALSFRSPRS